MTNEQAPSGPFPIIELHDKWRVEIGEIETPYIDCESREHAVAIANLRPYTHALWDEKPIDASIKFKTNNP